MKKLILLLLLVPMVSLSQTNQTTSLFKGLTFGMTKKMAKKEYKGNKELYNTVDIGNGWVWRTSVPNLIIGSKGLEGLYFYQKNTLLSGLGYDNTVACLNMTKTFFKNLGYTEFFEHKWWNAPVHFNNAYALVMVSPDKTKIAHIFPTKAPKMGEAPPAHTAGLILYDHDIFMSQYNKRISVIQKKQQESGF